MLLNPYKMLPLLPALSLPKSTLVCKGHPSALAENICQSGTFDLLEADFSANSPHVPPVGHPLLHQHLGWIRLPPHLLGQAVRVDSGSIRGSCQATFSVGGELSSFFFCGWSAASKRLNCLMGIEPSGRLSPR